jgi:hypothetical protein
MATKVGFVVERLICRDGEDADEEGEEDEGGGGKFSRFPRVPYMSNPLSMRPQEYDCGAFVAYKQRVGCPLYN